MDCSETFLAGVGTGHVSIYEEVEVAFVSIMLGVSVLDYCINGGLKFFTTFNFGRGGIVV